MKKTDTLLKKSVSRRSVLKGGAAIAGATAITGFPTVWAQNIKDITLNHTGMSYSTIADIARQATLDLGFKVEMSVVDHPGLTNRMIQDPNSIDIADAEIWLHVLNAGDVHYATLASRGRFGPSYDAAAPRTASMRPTATSGSRSPGRWCRSR